MTIVRNINTARWIAFQDVNRLLDLLQTRGAYIKVILSTPYVSQDIYKKMINPKGYLKQITFYRWIFSLKFLLK